MTLASKFRQLGKVMSDSRWLPFYFQRRFLAPATRDRLADLVAARLRPAAVAMSGQPALDARLKDLQVAGITHFGQLLSAEQTEDLRRYFLSRPVHDPYRGDGHTFLPDSDSKHPDSHIAHHDARDVLLAPHLFDLINRPDILEIVSRFLGCKPTLGYLAAWWSYPTGLGAQQAEHFHRDVDDWRFVKLFIYLTDVGPDNGPHIYVSHSAVSPAMREIRRFNNQEVVDCFGSESILSLTGRAGDSFLENTFGVHKGQPVSSGRRLIFQAVYSMSALPYGPKVPVATLGELARIASGAQIDGWINRFYVNAE
jgi:hypothetical protein